MEKAEKLNRAIRRCNNRYFATGNHEHRKQARMLKKVKNQIDNGASYKVDKSYSEWID